MTNDNSDFPLSIPPNPLITYLDEDDLSIIYRFSQSYTVEAGEYFIKQGECDHSVFIVESGSVEVLKKTCDCEEEYCLTVLGSGSCIGEMSLIEVNSCRSASVKAREKSKLIKIDLEEFIKDKSYKSLYLKIVKGIAKELSQKLRNTNEVTVDAMKKELEESKKQAKMAVLTTSILSRHKKDLERLVEQRTAELTESKNNIENLLNNAGQGFLTFGSDFIIDDEYSLECEKIFGSDIGGMNSLDLFFEDSSVEEEIFNEIFRANKAEVDMYISLLPSNLKINDKFIDIKYKLLGNKEQKIMCILTDISEKIELENNLEKERNNLKMVINVVVNQNIVKKYIEDYREYFTNKFYQKLATEDAAVIINNLYREVHTFKGIFSQWNMSGVAQNLHHIEDRLDKLKDNKELKIGDLLEFMVNLDFNDFLKDDIEIIEDTLGIGFLEDNSLILINKNIILELENKAKKYLSKEEYKAIKVELKKLSSRPFKDVFEVHKDYLKNLSKREDKSINSFKIEGDEDLFVDEATYYDFNKSLIHIFRNIIAHGIEFPEERKSKGKTEGGNIFCKATKGEDKLKIIIKDDGAGIDIDKLKKKAINNGIYKEENIDSISREEAISLIFLDSLSTKDKAEELTGRGVGMAAVKEEVSKLEGKISVKTEVDKGTEFEIVLPLIEG